MRKILFLCFILLASIDASFASCQGELTDSDPVTLQKPKKYCRSHFTGSLMVGVKNQFTTIFVEDGVSEYVGAGKYPDNEKAFPKSIAGTFDGVAIDTGTKITIYSGKNFTGDILLEQTGPVIINNIKWINNSSFKNTIESNWQEPYQSDFPQSVRIWSASDMHKWRHGSMIIECGFHYSDPYSPNITLSMTGDMQYGIATDSEDTNANQTLDNGEDINNNGLIDKRAEDLNGNDALDVGEDKNNDGMLSMDSGIAKIALCSDAENIKLEVAPFNEGDLSVDFTVRLINPLKPGKGTVLVSDMARNVAEYKIPEFGGCFVRFDDKPSYAQLDKIRKNMEIPGKLELDTAAIKGKPKVSVSTNFDLTGAVLEIDLGNGWVELDNQSLTLTDSGSNSWPVRVRTGRCPSGDADTFTIFIEGADQNKQAVTKSIIFPLEVLTPSLLECWWPVIAITLATLLIALIIYGFISPFRFSRNLGVVLSPEEDIAEGFFHPIRAARGTGSGFYRDARAYIRADFSISGKSSGAIACLHAYANKARIKPVNGHTIYRQNVDGEWEEIPTEETAVRYGVLHKEKDGGLFFEIRNA